MVDGAGHDNTRAQDLRAQEGGDDRFAVVRVKGGAWHVGWRWKVWCQVGEWFVLDVGLGRLWLNIGRFAFNAERHGGRELTTASVRISWRRSYTDGSAVSKKEVPDV